MSTTSSLDCSAEGRSFVQSKEGPAAKLGSCDLSLRCCLSRSMGWVPGLERTNALESGTMISQWCRSEVVEYKEFTLSVRLVAEGFSLVCKSKLILIPAITMRASYFPCSKIKYITTPTIFRFSVICCLVLFMNISFLLHCTEWLVRIRSRFKKHPLKRVLSCKQ